MPHAPGQICSHFLRRLHRRLVLLRIAEAAGLGLLIAAALALIILPILLLRGHASFELSPLILAAGALFGALAGLLRKPNLLATATEADRQLDLHDLLSSASLLLANTFSPPDPFHAAVLASADARCQSLAPSAVILNRLGARSWGGISLATLLVLALGLLSAEAPAIHADATATSPYARSNTQRQRPLRPPPAANAVSGARSNTPVNDDPENGDDPAPSPDQIALDGSNAPGRLDSQRATDATGPGSARSNVKPPGAPPTLTGADARPTPGHTTAGGAGVASSDTAPGDNTGTARTFPPSRPSPAWTAPDWPAAQQQADQAVRENHVPAAYHDLIRAYFER